MKKVIILFTVLTIWIPFFSIFPQSLSDYVKEVKGDTLVIKDYYDMNSQPNSLHYALLLDSADVPAGRVYELQAGGLYSFSNVSPISSSKHPTVIVGSDPTMVVNNKNTLSSPPLICTDNSSLGWATGIDAAGDLTIKNCELVSTADDGRIGIKFTLTNNSDLHLTYDNCLFEHCAHWFVFIRDDSNQNVTFRNCFFVNMNGQPCRRDGGVFISFHEQDTLLVENCTHIMAQGHMYKFMIYPDNQLPWYPHDYQFKRIIFNHNTFINCAGLVFMNPGYQSSVSLTNNIFVNCNVQSFGGINEYDVYEQDPDGLPMGLVNVYPDSVIVANNTPRKFLCQNNLVYWDPTLADTDSILNARAVNDVTDWQSQMIIMNTRTDSMFKHIGRFDAEPYSYLVTDSWKNKLPDFTDPQDLFTTQLANLKTFALGTVDLNSVDKLSDWRLVNNDPDRYAEPDWPIPVDLSYSDDDLLTAGYGGFPIGDLNWFPAKKADWYAQRIYEYDIINNALNAGRFVTEVNDQESIIAEFQLQQNYPNPFNPGTIISFTIPEAGFVSLKVYNILGQEVAALIDDFIYSKTNQIKFDGSDLASGVYVARLSAGNFDKSIKLILIK
ncbi:MAG: T9SS type A sorting domain-containing protein [Melioribacteraceae bacterium]|nr:T9SS type A sorting domain-containing protein [Melioribacteraceae bacterium]